MVIRHPLQCVVSEIASNLVALGIVKIDGLPPRRLVEVGEIRRKIRQVISFWAQVVVNRVERHCDPKLMTSVNKPLQPQRPAI